MDVFASDRDLPWEEFLSTAEIDLHPQQDTQLEEVADDNYASGQASTAKGGLKLEKLRARNRKAQARYRQKAKEELEQLEHSIRNNTEAIKSAQDRRKELTSTRNHLYKQCSTCSAALETIVSLTRLIPVRTDTGQAQRTSGVAPSCSAVTLTTTAGGPQSTTWEASMSTVFGSSGVWVPPPLASYTHHKPISLDLLRQSQDSSTRTFVQHSDCATNPPDIFSLASQFQVAEAAKCGCAVSDIAWYVSGATTVNGPGSVSFSTALNSGPCVSSYILTHYHLALVCWLSQQALNAIDGREEEAVRGDVDTTLMTGADYQVNTNTPQHKRTRGAASKRPTPQPTPSRRKPLRTTPEVMALSGVPESLLDMCQLTAASGRVVAMKETVRACFRDLIEQYCAILPPATLKQCCRQVIELQERTLFREAPESEPNMRMQCPVNMAQKEAAKMRKEAAPLSPQSSSAEPDAPSLGKSGARAKSKHQDDNPVADKFKCLINRVEKKARKEGKQRLEENGASPEEAAAGVAAAGWASPWLVKKTQEVFEGRMYPKSEDLKNPDTAAATFRKRKAPKTPTEASIAQRHRGATTAWAKQNKQECRQHMLGVMLIVRAELMTIMDTMPDVVSAAPEENKLRSREQVVRAESRHVSTSLLGTMLTILSRPKLSLSLQLESVQYQMDSYFEVDNMHMRVYKEINPDTQRRAHMAEFWRKWERRKRQMDSDMQVARMKLAALPTDVPLPQSFLLHLELLTKDSDHEECQPPVMLESPWMSVCDQQRMPYLFAQLCSQTPLPQPPQRHLDIGDTASGCEVPGASTVSTPTSLSAHSAPQGSVRFLGQFPEDMVKADNALQALQEVQKSEREMLAALASAMMPGTLLEEEQSLRVWYRHFDAVSTAPDIMELCQIAATQENRGSLFKEPFPGAAVSGCFRHVLTPDSSNDSSWVRLQFSENQRPFES